MISSISLTNVSTTVRTEAHFEKRFTSALRRFLVN